VRRRLDAELVRRGLVVSREQAAQAIAERRVLVAGVLALKPSRQVGTDDPVVVLGPGPRFVSRGGEKLDAALEAFAVDVDGLRVLDAGSSTGGFVDCLLQRGAAEVTAVDVGRGQLDDRLRRDPRVRLYEGVNVRFLEDREDLGGPFDLVTADLSFISLRVVVPALVSVLGTHGRLVLLVKPQFEAGRKDASRARGVIRDPQLWRQALGQAASALGAAGTGIMGAMVSPLTGAAGNVEFFLYAHKGVAQPPPSELDAVLADAVSSVVPDE
jgi:23S rRNA (cytidine1920-2'-O)/16S rRNA (cytidine1409-2'-O)-methyltransferase